MMKVNEVLPTRNDGIRIWRTSRVVDGVEENWDVEATSEQEAIDKLTTAMAANATGDKPNDENGDNPHYIIHGVDNGNNL